ncbi:SIMPL domain-containing protein [Streptomyces sp. NPDC059894]|uniref:SIMPL domain-containing protein n=1 Tax=unclassified Streptomyces TaxID=2593676 RepID=UPI0036614CAC
MATPTTPYGTPDAPLLTVHGETTLDVEPDIARIGITLTARGRDRRTTLDDLTHRNTTALDLIKSYGTAIDTLSTSALSLTPELTPHGRDEHVRTYHGHLHITTALTDFTALGELTTRLADLDLTHVDGPSWELRPDSPAHRRARRQAVHDALRRAHEYAEALNTTLTALIQLTDTAAATQTPRPRAAFDRRALRASAATPDIPDHPEPLDLQPRRLRIQAEVTAQFTMAPPRL